MVVVDKLLKYTLCTLFLIQTLHYNVNLHIREIFSSFFIADKNTYNFIVKVINRPNQPLLYRQHGERIQPFLRLRVSQETFDPLQRRETSLVFASRHRCRTNYIQKLVSFRKAFLQVIFTHKSEKRQDTVAAHILSLVYDRQLRFEFFLYLIFEPIGCNGTVKSVFGETMSVRVDQIRREQSSCR
jgi:hypothetical protein